MYFFLYTIPSSPSLQLLQFIPVREKAQKPVSNKLNIVQQMWTRCNKLNHWTVENWLLGQVHIELTKITPTMQRQCVTGMDNKTVQSSDEHNSLLSWFVLCNYWPSPGIRNFVKFSCIFLKQCFSFRTMIDGVCMYCFWVKNVCIKTCLF